MSLLASQLTFMIIIRNIFILALLSVSGLAQVTSVKHEYLDSLPSRGAAAIIEGSNFTDGWSDQADDILLLPENIRGVTVTIDGAPCRLRGVSPTRIAFVIAYDTPAIEPVRLKWNRLEVRNSATGAVFPFRVYINDTSPWLIQMADGYVAGLVQTGSGFAMIVNGVIPVTPGGARVMLWGTGVFSNFRPEWQIYYIILIDEEFNYYEIPGVTLSRGTMVYGWDNVIFDISPAVAAQFAGKTLDLVLQTPSAFSQSVKVKIAMQ